MTEAVALEAEGRHWIDTYGGQQLIDYECKAETELRAAEDVLSGIKSARLTAVQTIINKVYDSIGFNEIRDEELRHLLTIISKEYDLTDYFNTGANIIMVNEIVTTTSGEYRKKNRHRLVIIQTLFNMT